MLKGSVGRGGEPLETDETNLQQLRAAKKKKRIMVEKKDVMVCEAASGELMLIFCSHRETSSSPSVLTTQKIAVSPQW